MRQSSNPRFRVGLKENKKENQPSVVFAVPPESGGAGAQGQGTSPKNHPSGGCLGDP